MNKEKASSNWNVFIYFHFKVTSLPYFTVLSKYACRKIQWMHCFSLLFPLLPFPVPSGLLNRKKDESSKSEYEKEGRYL